MWSALLGIGKSLLTKKAVGSALAGAATSAVAQKGYNAVFNKNGSIDLGTASRQVNQPWYKSDAAMGAIGTIGASALNSGLSYKSAQNQMNYQTKMSNTSYQRGMADMRAAGLNPMLAYSQGGASTPGGAQFNPNIQNPVLASQQSRLMSQQIKAATASTALQAATDKAILKNKSLFGLRTFSSAGGNNAISSASSAFNSIQNGRYKGKIVKNYD